MLEAGGIPALAGILGAPGSDATLQHLAALTLASLAVDAAAKVRLGGGMVVVPAQGLQAGAAALHLHRCGRNLRIWRACLRRQVPVMVHAGGALVAVLRGTCALARGPAAAALRLSIESLDARRKLEGLVAPAEAAQLLGRLPDTPPCYRQGLVDVRQ